MGATASIVLSKVLRKQLRNAISGDPDIPINATNANSFYGVPTFADLQEGSTYMNGINSFGGPYTQRVMIWGNENSPVHWRLVSSLVKDNNNDPWTSTDDEAYLEFANVARDLYHGQYVNEMAWAASQYALLNFPAAAYHTWCANEWKDGRDWLDASESIWANLIGANTTSLLAGTYATYTDICSPEEWVVCQQNYSEAYCMLQCYREDQVPYYVSVQAGSDGLVPIYSQQAKVSNWSVGPDRLYEAVGVNHHEMRGHTNMIAQLTAVFNRSEVFKLEFW